CKGLSWLSCEMSRRGIAVSKQTIANKLVEFGYSNLRHRMVIEGQPCPDCHAQYAYINDTSAKFLTSGTPVIAIISRRTIHNPITTAFNLNTCYFGIDQADIFSIAMQSIAAWWREEGKALNVNSNKIMIIFDYGGGSSADNLSWNHELRRFVNEFGLSVAVSHFPPGIRRWNVSEHRLLTYLYKSHAGHPLLTYQTTVDLIGRASNTTPIKLERKWTRTRSEPPVRSYRGRHEW
ncbi:MAG: hypothetical protein LIP23_10515, partial [Planctomycetes bacterium]|nr:hypothetical protein [Planctomycetota bacterium]